MMVENQIEFQYWSPVRRRFGPDAPFFASGNIERELLAKQVFEAEEKTAGGLLLTEASKEKPSIGTVVAVGPGPLDEEGNRNALSVSEGNTVLYSKYAGNDFKGADGSLYIALRALDVMVVLS